ncbi:hypothetical protein [Acidovorax sp. 16-64-162]|uniref:hypothetical protein n=1 Tax=Acidovorax sp. 16-64-162 TaxID=1970307 RepID=UPI0025C38263|nr:hypothetical protein [Acidovorax sp. 16-64-162]
MHDDFLNPQTTLSRRHALALLAAPLAAAPALGVAAALPQITLAGPPAIVSAPLIHMAESNALQGVAQRTVFTAWRDPDQLRMMAMGGKADVLAMPSNVAANLFNRGAGVTLLNVSTWGAPNRGWTRCATSASAMCPRPWRPCSCSSRAASRTRCCPSPPSRWPCARRALSPWG